MSTEAEIDVRDGYAEKYGFHDTEQHVFKSRKGLDEAIVREISKLKGEPEWMLEYRLKALDIFGKKPMPTWGGDVGAIDFQDIYYYVKPTSEEAKSWEDVPEDMKRTFDKLGIPEAEQQVPRRRRRAVRLRGRVPQDPRGPRGAGRHLPATWIRRCKEHPELVQAVLRHGHPARRTTSSPRSTRPCGRAARSSTCRKGVHVEMPLQAYFRINTENMGQFERTLIIADEGAYVHYVEGCTAPIVLERLAALGRGRDRRQAGRAAAATRPSRTGRTTSTTWSPSGRVARRERDHGVGRRQPRLAS
jgi:Fe-S cluster assembly protein SufB